VKPRSPLPRSICFRITRNCNANCCFCLAPPDGTTADLATLKHRVDWLLERGVKEIHLCGGEPTIHPALPDLLFHIHSRNAKSKLTTNGIELKEPVMAALRATGTQVKVSLHGDRAHHDRMVGRVAFNQTVHNLQRLLRAGVSA
jgi:molybdenum cofactor biosynthesis enzyme MoaA